MIETSQVIFFANFFVWALIQVLNSRTIFEAIHIMSSYFSSARMQKWEKSLCL